MGEKTTATNLSNHSQKPKAHFILVSWSVIWNYTVFETFIHKLSKMRYRLMSDVTSLYQRNWCV